MAERPLPVGVCTRCGNRTTSAEFINQRCGRRINGKRCDGAYGSAIRPDDWAKCRDCGATGWTGQEKCASCNGSGWTYERRGP